MRWLLAVTLLLAGCSTDAVNRDGRLRVIAGFYPLAFLAERVGGPQVAVENLTPAGAEPHDLELKASQVAKIRSADLVVHMSWFQGIDDYARPDQELDLRLGDSLDLHVWLDPVQLADLAGMVAERLVELSPHTAGVFRGRARAFAAELWALDKTYRQRLAGCARREFVTAHQAFGHLAARYDLHQTGIAGYDPHHEPSAGRLADVVDFVRAKKITTIFVEPLAPPDFAETVARSTGAKVAVLDPIESIQPGSGADYFSLMRANLDALAKALDGP